MGRALGFLKPPLAALCRTAAGGDADKCWTRVHYLCVERPHELSLRAPPIGPGVLLEPPDAEMVSAPGRSPNCFFEKCSFFCARRGHLNVASDERSGTAQVAAAPRHVVAGHVMSDLRRAKRPIYLEDWADYGDDVLGRRAVVTRMSDDTRRPPHTALPDDELAEIHAKELRDRMLVHRSVAEEMWAPPPAGPPRKWELARPAPPAVAKEVARRELPCPLVPEVKLRRRVFDRMITGRIQEGGPPG